MSTFIIPTFPGVPFYEQEVVLEGASFRLRFQYNQREDCYSLSIGDPGDITGVDLVSSIKVVTNKRLIARYSGAASPWPAGEMMAVSQTNDDAIAGLNDLGDTVQLLYITSDDVLLSVP